MSTEEKPQKSGHFLFMAAGAAIFAAGVFLGASIDRGAGCKCGAEKPVPAPVAPHGKVIGVPQ